MVPILQLPPRVSGGGRASSNVLDPPRLAELLGLLLSEKKTMRNTIVAALGRKMDRDLTSAEAKGQINIAWGQRGKEDGGRVGKQGAVCYIPALPPAQGAARVQAAKWSWSCAAQNFGDFGHCPYLGLGAGEGRGKRGRGKGMPSPQRSPRQRDWAGLGAGLGPWETQTQPCAREKASN